MPKGCPILFILNRVDNRKTTDDPLDERLTQLKGKIKEKLGLPDEPDIIRLVSLALYYAQCAWWWDRDGNPTDKRLQSNLIKGFFEDCAVFIKRFRNKDIKQWLRDIEDELDKEDKDIPDELLEDKKVFEWLCWVYESSGGGEIWKQLKDRVQESFGEVVIAPILFNPLNSLNLLLGTIDEYDRVQRLESKDIAEKKKNELEDKFGALESFLEKKGSEFKEKLEIEMKNLAEAFLNSDSEKINTTLSNMFNICGDTEQNTGYIEAFRSIVSDVKKDLIDTIIIPVRDFYLSDLSISYLEEKLKLLPNGSKRKLIDIAYKYKNLVGEAINTGLEIEAQHGNKENECKITRLNTAVNSFFKNMRECLSCRAEFILQTKNSIIEGILKAILNQGFIDIEQKIKQEIPSQSDTVIALYRQHNSVNQCENIPENLFVLPHEKDINTETRYEKIGSKTEYYETSCLGKPRTRQVDNFGNVKYSKLILPSIEKMVELWLKGIENAESSLWQIVGEWLVKSLQQQMKLFEQSVTESRDILINLLNRRLQQTENEYQYKLAELDRFSQWCKNMQQCQESLGDYS